MIGTFTLGRHANAGSIEDAEVSMLRMIAPHFRRTISISKLLDLQTNKCATFAKTLDALSAGTIFVDARMRVVYANEAATSMLTKEDLCFARNGVLRFFDLDAASHVHAAVTLATRSEAELSRRGIGVPARGRNGDPVFVHLLPLIALPIDALAALYDLTPAEARVMELVVEARSPIEISKHLGIATSTVKRHLLKVFAKTGCKRQIDLIKVARSFMRPG
jgi:DNA-binding CsgD family transcriptional regulator